MSGQKVYARFSKFHVEIVESIVLLRPMLQVMQRRVIATTRSLFGKTGASFAIGRVFVDGRKVHFLDFLERDLDVRLKPLNERERIFLLLYTKHNTIGYYLYNVVDEISPQRQPTFQKPSGNYVVSQRHSVMVIFVRVGVWHRNGKDVHVLDNDKVGEPSAWQTIQG